MKRTIDQELIKWKKESKRLPLIIRGARQVGKSFTIEQFGRNEFTSTAVVNFEVRPEFEACFRTPFIHRYFLSKLKQVVVVT